MKGYLKLGMDTILVVRSKLVIPEVPDKALLSDRIRDLNIAGHKASVITAPAGFGKTTAVILSLSKVRAQIRWYRMERDDSFFPLFYAHLIDALFSGQDRGALDCVRTLSSLSNVSEEYLLQNALICQDAWLCFSDSPNAVYLVLDDFHNVLANPLIAESVRYYIANMPDAVRIIVMSRAETGILTGKMAYDPHYARIDTQALRFTREETERLLREKYRLRISDTQMERIIAYSEGWIAGLSMICLVDNPFLLQDRIDPSTSAKDQPEWFRHFFSEFLSGIDDVLLLNLARMSILPDFSCDDLTGILRIHNAQEIVEWLETSNIYIQKFMTKPIKYRFHSLFRMELEAYLNEHVSDLQIKALRLAAVNYYAVIGEVRLAIHFFIAADQIDDALSLASEEGVRIVHSATPEKLIPIILEFPEYCIQTNPYLLLFRGISLMSIQSKESFQCLLSSLLLFKERHDVRLMMDAPG